MATDKDRDRIQVNLSPDVREFLELKSKLTGKPPGSIAGMMLFDAMVRESPDLVQYLQLREQIESDQPN
jgi:hypothetical protein